MDLSDLNIRQGQGMRSAISETLPCWSYSRAHSWEKDCHCETSCSLLHQLKNPSGEHSPTWSSTALSWSTHVQQLCSMYSLGCYQLVASPGQPQQIVAEIGMAWSQNVWERQKSSRCAQSPKLASVDRQASTNPSQVSFLGFPSPSPSFGSFWSPPSK